ncbi:hypothetical protein AAG906_003652 [Vitis piasezkii]
MAGEMKKLVPNKVENLGGDIEVDDEGEKGQKLKEPAIFSRFSTFGLNIISQAFIGHIGSAELAAYALVFTVLLRFANGIPIVAHLRFGMACSLQTLCGQSFGAKQYHMLGIYLQRSWLVVTIASLFLLALFIFTTPILKALGQEEEITELAGYISCWPIPVMFAFIVSYTCQIYLQAQSKNMTIAYLAVFTLKYKFGLEGALVSTALAYWIPNIGQLMFIFYGGCPETWKGFSSLVFKDLWPVIKLSLSSGVMVCLELWYNTILVLLTGNMKNAHVAIDALSIWYFFFPSLFLGFSLLILFHVYIGFLICNLNINGWEMMILLDSWLQQAWDGSSQAAKFSIVLIVLTSFAIGFVLFIFFLFFRGCLAYIFTDSHDVAKAIADLSPLLACSMLLNNINQFSHLLPIGIPIGVVLGYTINLQVKGVWMQMLIGTFLQTVVLVIITYRTDWEKQVSIARARVNQWYR